MRNALEMRNVTVQVPLRLLGDVYLAAAKQDKNIDDVVKVAFEAWLATEVATGQALTGQADGTSVLPEAAGKKAPRQKETRRD